MQVADIGSEEALGNLGQLLSPVGRQWPGLLVGLSPPLLLGEPTRQARVGCKHAHTRLQLVLELVDGLAKGGVDQADVGRRLGADQRGTRRSEVALVDPELLQTGELLVSTVQQQWHSCAILNVGGMHSGSEDQATGIDQEMPLAAIDALGAVVAADTADARGADRLAVDDARTGLRLAPDHGSELATQDRVQKCPGAIEPPQPEVVIGGLPGWELVREQPPGAATPNDIEDRVQDLADGMEARPSNTPRRRQVGLETIELAVREVSQVRTP